MARTIKCECNYSGDAENVDGLLVCPKCKKAVEPMQTPKIDKITKLEKENAELKQKLANPNLIEMRLQLQGVIAAPPIPKAALWDKAVSNDALTADSWRATWTSQIEENAKNFDMPGNDVISEYGKYANRPCILAGSGPSLKKNIGLLKHRKDIPVISCLHNFAFMVDEGIDVEYYLNLDAGEITLGEVSQLGDKSQEYYWEQTKDKTLVTVNVGYPELLKKWRGKILFFNTTTPDIEISKVLNKHNCFGLTVFNVGGHALGATLYMARAILGCCPVALIGADFSFDYKHQFHPKATHYDDKFSGVIPCTDIFGNRVYTWPSYFHFKCWWEYMAMWGRNNKPYMFYNCTEGGILGSWPDGNIQQIIQLKLADFLEAYNGFTVFKDEKERLLKKKTQLLLY